MGTNGPWHHQMCYHRLPQHIKIKPISLQNIDVSHKYQLQKPTNTNTQPTQIIHLSRNQLSHFATTENTSSLNYNKINNKKCKLLAMCLAAIEQNMNMTNTVI